MRRLLGWINGIPHLFGKAMVVWCVICGTAFSFYALRILSRTGHDASGLLAVILAFFGGELALMFGKNALAGKRNTPDVRGEEEEL